jgi:uncharacterized protein YkwD
MRTSRLFRPLAVGLLALLVLLPACTSKSEQGMAKLVNAERSRAGLPTLVLDDKASALARDWSRSMARSNSLRHNTNLASDITRRVRGGWTSYGENVGYNSSWQAVHRGFMQSPGHRANILKRGYTRVGVGIVQRNGKYWVTLIFIGY